MPSDFHEGDGAIHGAGSFTDDTDEIPFEINNCLKYSRQGPRLGIIDFHQSGLARRRLDRAAENHVFENDVCRVQWRAGDHPRNGRRRYGLTDLFVRSAGVEGIQRRLRQFVRIHHQVSPIDDFGVAQKPAVAGSESALCVAKPVWAHPQSAGGHETQLFPHARRPLRHGPGEHGNGHAAGG